MATERGTSICAVETTKAPLARPDIMPIQFESVAPSKSRATYYRGFAIGGRLQAPSRDCIQHRFILGTSITHHWRVQRRGIA